MSGTINIKLKKFQYSGDSIGKDIYIETKIGDKVFVLDKIIKQGVTTEVDYEIANFSADQKINTQLDIKVIEKDLIFNDVGSGSLAIKFDPQNQITQEFIAEIKVNERKRIFRKSTAVFILTFQVQVTGMRSYNSHSARRDYNRYDLIIQTVVDYWNSEFLKDSDLPKELLDPNLVKAIIYQESRMGYDPTAGINVMQVGKPGDPSLKTLRGELPEYWIHNGQQQLLKYDVHIKEVKDSIYLGVRWLYHKAQGITTDNRRYWRTWKEAMHQYGPNTQKYTDNVWNIYTKGVAVEGKKSIKLWTALIILIGSLFLLVSQNKTEDLKVMVFASLSAEEQEEVEDIEIKFYDQSLFLAILEWDKDWWEYLRVGRRDRHQIKWLTIENPPTENSILSARWMRLKGFVEPILEVYGETHVGNGALYLYKLNTDILSLIFQTVAVDKDYDTRWHPEHYQKYGFGACGEVYTDGKLSATYHDINNDGISDIELIGRQNIICDQEYPNYDNQVTVSEVPVRLTYFLKPQ